MAEGHQDMHPAHKNLLRYFATSHLPDGLKERSEPFRRLAGLITQDTTRSDGSAADGPEITVALRKLLEAKDAFVRAHVPEPSDG